MAAGNLKQEQKNFLNSLVSQGILDGQLYRCVDLRESGERRFIIELINTFRRDAENCTTQLTGLLNEPVVDFDKVVDSAHRLKGCVSSVGAGRLYIVSLEVQKAGEERNLERCVEYFNKVKDEYQVLNDNLEILMQMEKTIIVKGSRRRRH